MGTDKKILENYNAKDRSVASFQFGWSFFFVVWFLFFKRNDLADYETSHFHDKCSARLTRVINANWDHLTSDQQEPTYHQLHHTYSLSLSSFNSKLTQKAAQSYSFSFTALFPPTPPKVYRE